MKRLVALIMLGLVGFYLVWPAWSGYRIASAIQSRNAALIESKVDFASVRASLRPTIEREVDKEFDKQLGRGLGGMLGTDFKRQLTPKLVDAVLTNVITGENIIRIAREGGNAAGSVQKIVLEQMSKIGGLPGVPGLGGQGGGATGGLPGGIGGVLGAAGAGTGAIAKLPGGLNLPGLGGSAPATAPASAPATPAAAAEAKAPFGFSNIKSFSVAPLAYTLAVAKDATAAKPDATTAPP
jgi:hypothetical protein